jgi:hypothetical protein
MTTPTGNTGEGMSRAFSQDLLASRLYSDSGPQNSLGARLGKSASDRRVGTGAGNKNNSNNKGTPLGQGLRPKGMVYSESTPALGKTGGGGGSSPSGGLPKPGAGASAARSGIASMRPTATEGSSAAIFGSSSRFMSRFVFLTART